MVSPVDYSPIKSFGLDLALARSAIEQKVAQPLGMDVESAAKAIISVANANMADAIRLVSIVRGHDPRDFALVAFGGAGALHGAALAKDLSIPAVIVPPHPGVTSALGCLLVDIQHDLLSTYVVDVADADETSIEREFETLEAEAHERLSKEGVRESDMLLKRTIDMRYHGQWRSLTVQASSPFVDINEAVNGFNEAHLREFSYQRDGAGLEIFRLNLTAVGITPKAELTRHSPSGEMPEPRSKRIVIFDNETVETAVYWREDLPSGVELAGPAVIEQLDSTTLIAPGMTAKVDPYMNLIISV